MWLLLISLFLCPICTFPLQMVKDDLADAHGLGCHLYIFIFLDVFECLFKGEHYWRDDVSLLICT